MWRIVIVGVPDVRGFREAESEYVGGESVNNGDAQTDSEPGKPKGERCTVSSDFVTLVH